MQLPQRWVLLLLLRMRGRLVEEHPTPRPLPSRRFCNLMKTLPATNAQSLSSLPI